LLATTLKARPLTPDAVEFLIEDELKAWYPRSVDLETGGFHSQFAHDWTPLPSQGRFVVFQARQAWTPAEVARVRGSETLDLNLIARHGLEQLRDRQWDPIHGGFFWVVNDDGSINTDDTKSVYGIAFGLYAAAAVARTTADESARKLAIDCFQWLDQHAHDAEHGGYHEYLARDGSRITGPIEYPGWTRTNDHVGTLIGHKSMNTHIHLLEAFTELRHVWNDPTLNARIDELLTILTTKIATGDGSMWLEFERDWTPVGHARDSFGHDVETAFLLHETLEAIGRDDEQVKAIARQLVDHAVANGIDRVHGGLLDPHKPDGKVWWAQAEALNAFSQMALLHPEELKYREALENVWTFVVDHQIDPVHGGWHEEVALDGTPIPDQRKGHDWKASYHTTRSLLWLRRRMGK
jgi:mannobiose 2-epimerase